MNEDNIDSEILPNSKAMEIQHENEEKNDTLSSEFEMQEKIIAALQKDNASLLNEKKALVEKVKGLEDQLANNEAKFSLLHSQEIENVRNASSAQLEEVLRDLKGSLERKDKEISTLKLETQKLENAKNSLNEAKQLIEDLRRDNIEKDKQIQQLAVEMSNKITSYLENTDFSSNQEKIIKSQEKIIAQLHKELAEKGKIRQETKHYVDEINSLKNYIKELKSQAKEKDPNSIPELIKSCQPMAESTNTIKRLERKIVVLEKALSEKDRVTSSAVDSLEEKMNNLKSHYEGIISDLQIKLRNPSDKNQSVNLTEFNQKESVGTGELTNEINKIILKDAQEEKANFLDRIKKNGTENSNLKEEKIDLEEKLLQTKSMYEEKIVELQRKAANDILELRQKYDEKLNKLEEYHRSKLKETADHLSYNPAELLENLKFIGENGKTSDFLLSVSEKLKYLEKRCIEKERQCAMEVIEARRIAQLEKNVMEQKMELIIDQKNRQIEEFRAQLDQLIASVATHKIPK